MTIVTGAVNIALVLVALFLLGTAETFADVGGQSLLPRLVRREDLGVANARLPGGVLLTNQLIAPPIGAPCSSSAWRSRSPPTPPASRSARCSSPASATRRRPSRRRRGRHWRADMAEGIRWLADHPPMRTLFITIVAFNVTFGAAWAVLVLYARSGSGWPSGVRADDHRDGDRRDRRHARYGRSSGGSRSPTSCASAC